MDKNIKKRAWHSHGGTVLDSKDGFDVIDCDRCAFKHIVPIPTPKELSDIYKEDYYSNEKPLYIERSREDIDWWNVVNNERYSLFESFLDGDKRDLLEIGSGPGFFLLTGQERSWRVRGIEPSKQAANHARSLGLDVTNDFLSEETSTGLGTFDCLYMHEVLEHIPDPRQLIRLCAGLIKARGLLCIVVPNDYNPFQSILRRDMDFAPWWVAPPHHINYFNAESLSTLITASGFEVVDTQATFPIDIFLLMGDNYIGNDKLGRECHGRRKNFEINMDRAGAGARELKEKLYRAFGDMGLGRETLILARRT